MRHTHQPGASTLRGPAGLRAAPGTARPPISLHLVGVLRAFGQPLALPAPPLAPPISSTAPGRDRVGRPRKRRVLSSSWG